MADATAALIVDGIRDMVFGDLYLEDIRTYRDQRMAEAGMTAHYPLWQRPTDELACDMLDAAVQAHVATVDLSKLDASFSGRRWDATFIADLPNGIDPCGENGEFHTCTVNGPAFREPLASRPARRPSAMDLPIRTSTCSDRANSIRGVALAASLRHENANSDGAAP